MIQPPAPPILVVDARVRYWEDATVNGKEDVDGTLIPFRDGDSWKPSIDLRDGRVIDWPEDTDAKIHYKVCDDGDYWLADSDGTKRLKYCDDYVPDDLLCVGDRGYGDYIILTVGPDGKIADWTPPLIDFDEWVPFPDVHSLTPTEWVIVRNFETEDENVFIDPDTRPAPPERSLCVVDFGKDIDEVEYFNPNTQRLEYGLSCRYHVADFFEKKYHIEMVSFGSGYVGNKIVVRHYEAERFLVLGRIE